MTAAKKPSIYERLISIQRSISYIKKRPSQGLPYPFVAHDDVAEAMQPLFNEHGVLCLPSVMSHAWDGNRITMVVRLTFVNVDNPEDRATVEAVGSGQGSDDKSAGKAMSYAVKMAMLKVFHLATGERDVETEDVPHTVLEPGTVRKFLKLLKAGDPEPFYEYVNPMTDEQKMSLWKEINTEAKANARELLNRARLLLAPAAEEAP